MLLRQRVIIAAVSVVVLLSACRASHRDVSTDSPHKEWIGRVCEVLEPLEACGYTFTVERDKKTDAISISNLHLSGPEITFSLPVEPGTTITLLDARECSNCPFDLGPEYRVHVSPEPPQFEGKPAFLSAAMLSGVLLRCSGGA